MGFFNKMFGTKSTPDQPAAETQAVDFIGALTLHLRGKIDPALGAYQTIYAGLPDDHLARFLASAIMADKGNAQEAAENLRDISRLIALEGLTISHAIAVELVSLISCEPHIATPAVAELMVAFGDQLKKKGFIQESAVCFEIAAGLVPEHANVLHKLGDTLHDLQNYDYAEAVLQEALKFAPHHFGALYTYAVLLQDLGRTAEAITCYERAVKLDPEHVKCQNNYGAALLMANRLEEALTHCTLAAELDPGFALARINIGNIYLLMRSYEAARSSFADAIALDGKLALGYFGLGAAEEFLGSAPGRIQELYLQALDLNPSFPDAHHALGNLLARDGNPEALTHFAAAEQVNNYLMNLQRDFGTACLKLGFREEGLAHLTMALHQNPDDVMARDLLAQAGE